MKKISILDLGNRNYKGQNGFLLSNKIIELNKNNSIIDTLGENTIELEDKVYLVGTEKAKVDTTYTKTEKTYIAQVLYFNSVLYKYDDIDLMVCLPNDQIENKTKLVEDLQGKTFKFKANGESKTLKIGKVMVVRESQAGFFSLDRNQIVGDCGVIDCGSYTTNVFLASNGKEISSFTVKKGTSDYFIGLSQHLSKFTKLDETECERYFDKLKKEYNEEIEKYTKEFTENLYKELVRNFSNIKYHNLVVTGGGSFYYYETLQNYLSLEKHKNPVFANVEGMEKVASMKGLI